MRPATQKRPTGAAASNPDGRLWKISSIVTFIAIVGVQLCLYQWPWSWLISGAPILTVFLLYGDATGRRILPFAHIWTLFTTLNLAYAVASTSWLLYWVFTALCYPAIYFVCLFQFEIVGHLTRLAMRVLLRHMHFVDDKIAVFDIPALDIDDGGVNGLMIVRGFTFSFSTLTFQVHGVDVSINISEKLEVAIRTEKVIISLFRGIELSDCFVNLKPRNQNHIVEIAGDDDDNDNEAAHLNSSVLDHKRKTTTKVVVKKATETSPRDSSPRAAIKGITTQFLQTDWSNQQYHQTLNRIDSSSAINNARKQVEHEDKLISEPVNRAAICLKLQVVPSITNPPTRSIKVSTLKSLTWPRVRRFRHRLPMLMRMLLNLISYFHPVKISSITAAMSGSILENMLIQKIFKHYGEGDSNTTIEHLKQNVSAWISDANYVIGLNDMIGHAQIPVIHSNSYNIRCQLASQNIRVYRDTLLDQTTPSLNEVIKLGYTDSNFIIPTFLLPHHEHLIPSATTKHDEIHQQQQEQEKVNIHTQHNNNTDNESRIYDLEKDQAYVKSSVRVRLPAILDQELLNFIATIVKASKLVELEQDPDKELGEEEEEGDNESSVRDFTESFNQKVKESFVKVAMSRDQWLAKQVGKIVKKLANVTGDVGYTGNIPVALEGYRNTGWLEVEGKKLIR